MEQYLCDQIMKEAGWLEDIFMQKVSLEQIRMPKPHTAGNKKYGTH